MVKANAAEQKKPWFSNVFVTFKIRLLLLYVCHQVMPFSVTDVVKEAGSLLADGSPLSKALGSKDLQKTTQLMSALALAINRQQNGTSGNSEIRELTKVTITDAFW